MKNEWIEEYEGCLRISEIEKRIGCPKFTLTKYISGERSLPLKWVIPFEEFMVKMLRSGLDSKEEVVLNLLEEEKIKWEITPDVIKDEVKKEKIDKIVVANGKEPTLKVLEEVPFKIDMSTVDYSTGEIKEKLVRVRLNWLFNRVDSTYDIVEPWISTSGNLFEVKKMFGSIAKYIYVDNLEDARRIVSSKNPLYVELSK